MDNYKAKYEMLLEAVEQLGNEPLKEIAEATKRLAVEVEEEEEKTTLTREEIMAIKGDVERQTAIRENLHLFN